MDLLNGAFWTTLEPLVQAKTIPKPRRYSHGRSGALWKTGPRETPSSTHPQRRPQLDQKTPGLTHSHSHGSRVVDRFGTLGLFLKVPAPTGMVVIGSGDTFGIPPDLAKP